MTFLSSLLLSFILTLAATVPVGTGLPKIAVRDNKCLTVLSEIDISKLISGRVGEIGHRSPASLSLFEAHNAKAEKMILSKDKSIELTQVATRRLLGVEVAEEKAPEKAAAGLTPPLPAGPFTEPLTGMEFVFIKGGCFEMGDTFAGASGSDPAKLLFFK
jgi:hypothetical protein